MITERLAEFAVGFPTSGIPEAAMGGAERALADLAGCAVAGSAEPVARIAREVAPGGAQGGAAVWGSPDRASIEDAAFINAVQSHALDFDDSSSNMRAHPSCSMLPAALAAGEAARAAGREVLAAYAVGLEVARRLTPALGPGHYLSGWHTTSTIGIFGAAAAAGRLLGLDARRQRHAFGLAGSLVGGLSRNFGSMGKPFHAGHAARAGVHVARLAAAGMTADADIFDGPQNVIAVYGGAADGALVDLQSLGSSWELASPGLLVKQWPCCYATHRAIAGVRTLQAEHGFAAADVERIRIGFPPGTEGPLRYKAPRTGLQGKFSVEYVLAALLLDGKVALGSFTDEMVMRPAAQALMARVERYPVAADGILSSLKGFTDVEVRAGGKTCSMRVDRTPGSSEWPLSDADRQAKFMDCCDGVLTAGQAQALARGLASFRALPDVRGALNVPA
ncbi:MmgE/PrpD family protein [Pigmentiphaga soli]|uniref:MmgE/PrpD family protein n=1 Tax=Pigmentiphaga soli TaxID=1007095 RepID=A0ABP8H904_9BURK